MVALKQFIIPALVIAGALFAGYQYAQNRHRQSDEKAQVEASERFIKEQEAAKKALARKQAAIDSLRHANEEARRRLDHVATRAKGLQAKMDSLVGLLPEVTPAACAPYSEALTSCQQAVIEKDLALSMAQTNARADSVALEQQRALAELHKARADSVTTVLKTTTSVLDNSGCHINFGLFKTGCLSRTTTFLIGTGLGVYVGLQAR